MQSSVYASVLRRSTASVHTVSSRRLFSSSTPREASWGFIGLGAMGYPMAKNLQTKIPKGDILTVFDVNRSSMDGLKSEAASNNLQLAQDPREVAQNSDYIVTALPEPQHVKSVFETILSGDIQDPPTQASRLYIDCSTIDPVTSREVAKLVKDKSGADFVDAPMSGGVVGASAGTLTFMVGAEKELMSKIEPILMLMGKKVWHMGVQGTGLSGKLANNYALAINNIAAAEAFNLGIRWGIEPKALADLLNSATGKSWPSEVNPPVPGVKEGSPSSKDYAGGFGVSLMNKDLRLAMKAANEANAKLVLGDVARSVYEATEKEYKGKDFSVVYRWLGGKE